MKEEDLHWADEKEAIKTNKPLLLVLKMMNFIPSFIVRCLVFPVSFFYLIFSSRARKESVRYQKQLRKFTGGKVPFRISSYRQIVSFSLSVFEKMEGWLGKVEPSRVQLQNDSLNEMLEDLKSGKGAVALTAHFGNMELMRAIANVPVYAVMNVKVGKQFTDTLKMINPNSIVNVIDSDSVGPDTMVFLIDEIEKGALVVSTGDRPSANARDRILKYPFLGKDAEFPYGVFLMVALLKKPVYYMFGFRERFSIFNSNYKLYVEKSKIDFNCRRAEREERINQCCKEFVEKLEKFCLLYPYQWYNFHNFWKLQNEES